MCIRDSNFPVAVWNWNTALAWVCGDVCVWKPSEKAPLCAVACQNIWREVAKENNLPEGVSCIVNGDYKVGEMMTSDERLPLISATGSTRMGRIVGVEVAKRLGKSLLELGGNNAIIVDETASMNLVVPAIVFGAVGTAGQRCTSTRRIIAHSSIIDDLASKLVSAYRQVKIGDPLDTNTLMGPLIDQMAVDDYTNAINKAKEQGGKVLCGGNPIQSNNGFFVEPTIIKVDRDFEIVKQETFAPILYIMSYNNLEEAIEMGF